MQQKGIDCTHLLGWSLMIHKINAVLLFITGVIIFDPLNLAMTYDCTAGVLNFDSGKNLLM